MTFLEFSRTALWGVCDLLSVDVYIIARILLDHVYNIYRIHSICDISLIAAHSNRSIEKLWRISKSCVQAFSQVQPEKRLHGELFTMKYSYKCETRFTDFLIFWKNQDLRWK